MLNLIPIAVVSLLLAGAASSARGEEATPGEDTMIVLEEGATPEDIVDVIQLPPAAAEGAARGSETAGAARGDGRTFGEDMASQRRGDAVRGTGTSAEQARERAAEVAREARRTASEASEEARQNAADEARRNAADAARDAREDARDDAGRPGNPGNR